jgi:glycosyltransferase involved in cell wall biosynthesis
MRIALVNTFIPYIRGGAEILVDDLAEQLQIHGHEVVLFRLPFPPSFEAPLIGTLESAHMLCFDEFDRVIAFKFPAYSIKHHGKVIWLLHQFRQVYDLWEGEHGLKPNPIGENIRKLIVSADNRDISSSYHVYTIAQEVTSRLQRFNNINSSVLYPPLQHHELYYTGKSGDYIFYPSRMNTLKRQHLAIAAMRHIKSGVRLVIAGVCEGLYFEQLKKLIHEYNLEQQVELRNEWISDEEKRSLIANALGIIFIPYKEDYGFVSLEAFYSAKPVITCIDSGGTREFVEDGVSGFEVQPTPEAIAMAMDKLFFDRSMTERMGKAGQDEINRRDITWPSTIRKLLT